MSEKQCFKVASRPNHQAPVVQTLDGAIHQINRCPVDKYYGNQLHYPLDRDLPRGKRINLLNDWGHKEI